MFSPACTHELDPGTTTAMPDRPGTFGPQLGQEPPEPVGSIGVTPIRRHPGRVQRSRSPGEHHREEQPSREASELGAGEHCRGGGSAGCPGARMAVPKSLRAAVRFQTGSFFAFFRHRLRAFFECFFWHFFRALARCPVGAAAGATAEGDDGGHPLLVPACPEH
jgi:hypothetical protein